MTKSQNSTIGQLILNSRFNSLYSRTRAFTLIELLVVIAIIGILVSIGVVGWVSVAQRGRDTTRKSDLARIKQALQQMYSDQRTYPRFDSTWGRIYGASWQLNPSGAGSCLHNSEVVNLGLSQKYLAEIPKDPKDIFDYSGVTECNDLREGQANRYIYLTPSPASGIDCAPNCQPSANPSAFVLMGTLERIGNEAVAESDNPLKSALTTMGGWYIQTPLNYEIPMRVNANYLVDSKNQ